VAVADVPLETEEKKKGGPLPHELVDVDIVADGFTGSGQTAMEADGGIEQAVGALALDLVIDAQIAAEKQIGLPGFDRDAHRRAVAVQVPGTGNDVVLGHQAAGAQAAFFAFHAQDAVHQHQRRIGQPHARFVGIDHLECRPEHLAHGSDGKLHALLAGKGNRFGGCWSSAHPSRRAGWGAMPISASISINWFCNSKVSPYCRVISRERSRYRLWAWAVAATLSLSSSIMAVRSHASGRASGSGGGSVKAPAA
jgi:hypothetical protein